MFLGDKWEHVFHLGKTLMRAHGLAQLPRGRHWVEIPREGLWVF